MAGGDRAEMEKSLAYYTQALPLAEELKMRPLVARINLSIGQLHQRAGARDAAEAYLGTSLTQLREMRTCASGRRGPRRGSWDWAT